MGLKKKAVLIPLTFLSLAGCGTNIQPTVYTRLMMDTIVELSAWEKTPPSPRWTSGLRRTSPAVELGFNEIQRIEEKFSIFKEDSEISKLNRDLLSPSPSPLPSGERDRVRGHLKMSPECRYLIQESLKYSRITHGAFNITVRPDKHYDLGGIAKGYAVDRVAQIFKESGITRAMINMGGNLYLIGYPPRKDCWTIGIKDPNQPDRLIGKLRLDKEIGIATSGDYERPGHIINPKTGLSAKGVLSVTIVAPKAITADALSTGVFVLGPDKGMELIESLPGVEGIIIFERNGKIQVEVSSGLRERYEGLY